MTPLLSFSDPMRRAFKVYSEESEAAVIVFAQSASEAKSIGRRSEWLEACDFLSVKALRLPEADKFAEGSPDLLDGSTKRSQEVMWLLDWYSIDATASCDECGRNEWEFIEERKVTFDGEGYGICEACKEQKQKEFNNK